MTRKGNPSVVHYVGLHFLGKHPSLRWDEGSEYTGSAGKEETGKAKTRLTSGGSMKVPFLANALGFGNL
jgi:hypothetical protein